MLRVVLCSSLPNFKSVCQNGEIERSTLINEPPLNGYDWIKTFGQHFVSVRDFVDKLHNTIVVA